MIDNSIKKLLKILFIGVLTIVSISSAYSYDLSNLDWSKSKKNYCARNVVNATGLQTSGNAHTYTKYIDKRENPEIGEIVVIDRYNKKFQSKGSAGYTYGHLAIITEVNSEENTIKTFDGYYIVTIKQSLVAGYLSVNKMIELGATNIY